MEKYLALDMYLFIIFSPYIHIYRIKISNLYRYLSTSLFHLDNSGGVAIYIYILYGTKVARTANRSQIFSDWVRLEGSLSYALINTGGNDL